MNTRAKTENKNAKVTPFIREASYYYQKGSYYFHKNKWQKAVFYFRKTVEVEPENPLNHYNLACLLSKIGRLKEANKVFKFIVEKLDPSLTECYFLMAVNFGLLEDLGRACKFLHLYLDLEPEGDMAEEARELLLALSEEEHKIETYLSLEEKEELVRKFAELNMKELSDNYYGDPDFRKMLRLGLYEMADELKEKIIRFFGFLGRDKERNLLYEFVRNPWVKERLRQIALLELKNMGVQGRCSVFFNGKFQEIDLGTYPLLAPVWKQEWQDVLDCTIDNMRRGGYYEEGFYEDVQAIWLDFINSVYPEVPPIKKVETWAAGLEYSLGRFHFLNATQKKLAEDYGVSLASVGAKFKQINEVLKIDQKAYQNMLSYLKEHEQKDE
ncbi:MAG: hypothetical protein ACOYBM_00490 [Dethiobacteria bacterium]|jgi:tetratricopeptide (TPR) repeat protein